MGGGSSLQSTSSASRSSSIQNESRRPKKTTKPPRKRSPERPPISYREPIELAARRGRETTRYTQQYRQQSQDRSINDLKEELRLSNALQSQRSVSRGRSWSLKSLSRRQRKSSEGSRSTSREGDENAGHSREECRNSYDDACDSFPRPDAMQPINLKTSTDSSPPPTYRFSQFSPTTSSFLRFRDATKNALKRHSYSPTSPTFPAPKGPAPQVRTRASTTGSMSASNNNNMVLGANKSSLSVAQGGIGIESSGLHLASDLYEPYLPTKGNSHSRMTTNPSVVTINYSTSKTTPAGSRPQSRKSRSSPGNTSPNNEPIGFKSHHLEKGNSAAPVGALFFDKSSRVYETWSHTAIPQNFDNEKITKMPAIRKKSIPNFSHHQPQSDHLDHDHLKSELDKVSASVVRRHPSLSKSISTPHLKNDGGLRHHLSLFPKLKHEPFSKTADDKIEKSKGKIPARLPLSISSGSSISSQISSNQMRFSGLNGSAATDPVAKMLVVCCSCRFFHDLPSKLYECMAKPDNVVEDKAIGISGVIRTKIKCPWCGHGMSSSCCEGYTAIVYLQERLH
jgi:hypothetical protein